MSIITPFNHPIDIACDECGFVLETETTDFKQAQRLMRRIFWKTEKGYDEQQHRSQWLHYCSECSEKVLHNMANRTSANRR